MTEFVGFAGRTRSTDISAATFLTENRNKELRNTDSDIQLIESLEELPGQKGAIRKAPPS